MMQAPTASPLTIRDWDERTPVDPSQVGLKEYADRKYPGGVGGIVGLIVGLGVGSCNPYVGLAVVGAGVGILSNVVPSILARILKSTEPNPVVGSQPVVAEYPESQHTA